MEHLGTFEEWYQHEMKARDSKKSWHYPTVLSVEYSQKPVIDHYTKRPRLFLNNNTPMKAVYRARHTDQPGRGFVPVTYQPTREN